MENKEMLIVTYLLLLIALCSRITALHEESENRSFCSSSESGEEAALDLQTVVNTCFRDAFDFAPPVQYIRICDDQGGLDCGAIRNALSIIPSCNYCNRTSRQKVNQCHKKQQDYTSCSVNNFLCRKQCVRTPHGKVKCECKTLRYSGHTAYDVTTQEQTTAVIPDETTSAWQNAENDKEFYKYNKKNCAPCECSQTDRQTGVSMGVAVGLLFVGVMIGAIVTAVICICVPSLHSRTSIIRGKMTERFQKSKSQDNTCQDQHDLDTAVTDNTLPVETTISYPPAVYPTAPVSSVSSNQARYHTLNTVSNSRDSHTYTGLQSDSPEYMGGGVGYQSPEIQPMKGPKTVVSPVYQEFTDNIIPSRGGNNDNHSPGTKNQPIRSTETDDATNHNYFVLEAQNEASNVNSTANGRPLSDHQYFVLEEQNGKNLGPTNIKDTTDPNYHEYFVLEKEQT